MFSFHRSTAAVLAALAIALGGTVVPLTLEFLETLR